VTPPYAEVIGDPVAHSKSPLIHKFWLEKLGLPGEYRALQVTAEQLPRYIAQRRSDPDWRGCSVTMPLKRLVGASLSRLSVAAEASGAVNCVHRVETHLVGENSDVDGIVEVLGSHVTGKRVAVIGTGGAACAALEALRRLEAGETALLSRTPERIEDQETRVHPLGEPGAALSGCACLINASPLGMTGYPAVPPSLIEQLPRMADDAMVFDMVYDPAETALLKAARVLGLATRDGIAMLIGQAARAFELFFGVPAPRHLDAELRERLAR
jgi:shikimate dehydrogenase